MLPSPLAAGILTVDASPMYVMQPHARIVSVATNQPWLETGLLCVDLSWLFSPACCLLHPRLFCWRMHPTPTPGSTHPYVATISSIAQWLCLRISEDTYQPRTVLLIKIHCDALEGLPGALSSRRNTSTMIRF